MKSTELQIGKAGEHLVCADLSIKGYHAFLADQGSPFDVVAEHDGALLRIQVRTTQRPVLLKRMKTPVYRFGLKRGVGSTCRYHGQCDIFAFVALDTKAIAYLLKAELLTADGQVKTCVEFNPSGTHLRSRFDKYGEFPPAGDRFAAIVPICHPDRKHYCKGQCRECYTHARYLAGNGVGRKRRAG